jgi:hypothetical protein
MYCMAARTLLGLRDQFSREYREWFAATGGGVLCHLPTDKLEPYDSWIGVGVDPDVIPAPVGPSNRVLFDFPRSSNENAASTFDVSVLDEVRAQLSECTIAGSGPADAPVRDAFDEWIAYGQDHATYVRAAYRNLFAFVPGWQESMGMPFAEAQMAGACIVFSERQAPEAMLCPDAAISYQAGDPRSLARALADARTRDRGRIRQQAAERFDFTEVVKRTRAAIGLTQPGLMAKLAGIARRTRA